MLCDVGGRPRRRADHAALAMSPGWMARAPMDSLFHALIMAIAIDTSASYFSEKCLRASSYTASGACVSAMCVSDSAQASAARSRAV